MEEISVKNNESFFIFLFGLIPARLVFEGLLFLQRGGPCQHRLVPIAKGSP